MSVDQLQKPKRAQRGDAKLVQYEEYIDRQVENTRRVVKIVDVATSFVVLAAGVLAYLLVVAMVEHWLVPGGFSELGRLGLFLILAWGVAAFVIRRFWPLVVGRVNPVYAAHAIEVSAEGGPSLKNSLVNLLLFRQKREGISDAVYHTLEEQAAQRLSRVPLDAAVDRTLLIRFGYLLIVIVAVAGLYKVFSPKDPIVAARRVLMPWAHIVPASRVQILNVQPGQTTISRGESVDLSAEVRGIGDDDTVVLRFTTADGQAVDKRAPMKLSRDSSRYEARLPVNEDSASDIGLGQDVTYRIEAGDARSLDYKIKVVEAPSILVERIEYDYPEYTGFVDGAVKERGDIKAIEGTRVTVHARANGPIKEAQLDFDADGRRDLTMQNRDADATVSFLLALRDDRRMPQHASYVLRFSNRDGRPNRKPVKHSIDVDPDYAPEASIISPREKLLDVRLDETVAIEVEARDPDFALADVRLRGQVRNGDAIDVPLLRLNHTGRFSARHEFTPSEHGLKAGEVVDYWVAANDNRAPKPNAAESTRQQFRIVGPGPQQQPPPDGEPQHNRQGEGQGKQQPQDGKAGQGEQGQKQDGTGGQGQPDEKQQPQQGDPNQKGQSQNGGETSRPTQPSADPGNAPQNQDEEQNTADSKENQPNQNQPGQQSDKQSQSGEQNSSDKQTGAKAAGGEPSQGAQSDGTRPDGEAASAAGRSGKQQDGVNKSDQQQPPNAGPSPVSSDGDNDGEAFERIQEHMQQDGDVKDGETPEDKNEFSRDAQRSAEQQDRRGEGEKGRQGDAGAEQNADAEQKPDAEKQFGDKSNESTNQAQEENQADEKKPGEQGEGTGTAAKGGESLATKQQPGDKNEQAKSPGGQETSTKGESGAGDEQKSQGAPNAKPDLKPTEKREQQPSPGEQSKNGEPAAGARGKKESDSQGEQGGDRAGGGEEGGGQKAQRDGTGSAGQNQSADKGAGESAEKGSGSDSQNAGQDAVSGKKTGQSDGKTPGRGSKTGEVPDAKSEPGDKPDPSEKDGKPLHQETPTSEESKVHNGEKADRGSDQKGPGGDNPSNNANRDATQSDAPTGAGNERGSNAMAPPRSTGTAPEGDEANLDYARKQTDLVLEKLSNQLNDKKVDDGLLKKLGWTEEDMRKFVDRWRDRKQAAERNDPAGDDAKRELDEALRSLGLRRGPLKQGQVKDDTMRDLNEGYRGPVPLEYQDRLRAYNQGVSRARTDDK